MGNQLVSIAPSQIFPVDYYLLDRTEMRFDANLGSTRFFKAARAKSQEGLIVVKVFAIHDPTLTLTTYKKRIEDIAQALKANSCLNCLPFTKTILTDKAAFICREFVKDSVYDRISTRPFLTNIEKKWIAFQVLYALHQCHKIGICHGDIKLENIMITSWNWILLTDFASFKPTYLPDDNPADYSFFFDTSRRRTCYIAPERFRGPTLTAMAPPVIDTGGQPLLPEEPLGLKAELTPAMDIFSAGCTLLELFNEGTMTFDLSQLLSYRNGDTELLEKHLDKVEDEGIRKILINMTQIDPNHRQTAENLLAEARGTTFPEYFYTFLQSFLLLFSGPPIKSADEKIAIVRKDIDQIVNKWLAGPDSEGLIMIAALIISCVRGVHYSSNKIEVLDILTELSKHIPNSDIILERIIPFIRQLLNDPSADVRRHAVHALTNCLEIVKKVPASDSNIFPEYVIPALSAIAHDEAFFVRAAYAKCIALIAETAIRYLDFLPQAISYDAELANIQKMLQQDVSCLLTDSHTLVKRTILERSAIRLCVCFGKHKANDVILSHVITFLNDKSDKHLRTSFYKSIVGVSSYVGCHCSAIITPLLIQGLSDPEEFVMIEALNSMKQLTILGLFAKSDLYELLTEVSPFLVHPNLWIRQAAVGFISSAAKYSLRLLDVQCKLLPMIMPYIKQKILLPDHPALLMNILRPMVPRQVWDTLIRSNPRTLESLLHALRDRRQVATTNILHIPHTREIHPETKQLLRRLNSDGMTESIEDYILQFSRQLLRVCKYRNASLDSEALMFYSLGHIGLRLNQTRNVDLLFHPTDRNRNSFAMGTGSELVYMVEDSGNTINGAALVHTTSTGVHPSPSSGLQTVVGPSIGGGGSTGSSVNVSSPATASQPSTTMNEEWMAMFAKEPSSSLGNITLSAPGSSSHFEPTVDHNILRHGESIPVQRSELDERSSYIEYKLAPCRSQVRCLIDRKARQLQQIRVRSSSERQTFGLTSHIGDWKFRGSLVAHLHEHRAGIVRLAAFPSMPLFASASLDGYVRLWDCAKMEGRNIANRSKYAFRRNNAPLAGLTVCDNAQSLATSTEFGVVYVLRAERLAICHQRQLDLVEEGPAVDVLSLSPNLITYATMYGSLVGWDLRAPGFAWKLENTLKHGVITAFCAEPEQGWAALGTANGYHFVWDLRFKLRISELAHPFGSVIRRITPHPTEPSDIISAVQGNNDISIWNIETGHRHTVLWASPEPPLSNNPTSKMSVLSLFPLVTDKSSILMAAGTDMRVRLWDLNDSSNSRLAIRAANDNIQTNFTYNARLIDGTHVVQEQCTSSASQINKSNGPESPGKGPINDDGPGRPGPEAPQEGHHDSISDVVLANSNTQNFIVTGSKDGVIKELCTSSASQINESDGPEEDEPEEDGPEESPGKDPINDDDPGKGLINNGCPGKGQINDDGPGRLGPAAPHEGHYDWITDLILANSNTQNFIVTGGRDGVIKVWK